MARALLQRGYPPPEPPFARTSCEIPDTDIDSPDHRQAPTPRPKRRFSPSTPSVLSHLRFLCMPNARADSGVGALAVPGHGARPRVRTRAGGACAAGARVGGRRGPAVEPAALRRQHARLPRAAAARQQGPAVGERAGGCGGGGRLCPRALIASAVPGG
eukprot:3887991-Rhodomonas_salina.4